MGKKRFRSAFTSTGFSQKTNKTFRGDQEIKDAQRIVTCYVKNCILKFYKSKIYLFLNSESINSDTIDNTNITRRHIRCDVESEILKIAIETEQRLTIFEIIPIHYTKNFLD